MIEIEFEIRDLDRTMKSQSNRVYKAMRETVDLYGLSEKMLGKYLKFLQQKCASRIDELDGSNL